MPAATARSPEEWRQPSALPPSSPTPPSRQPSEPPPPPPPSGWICTVLLPCNSVWIVLRSLKSTSTRITCKAAFNCWSWFCVILISFRDRSTPILTGKVIADARRSRTIVCWLTWNTAAWHASARSVSCRRSTCRFYCRQILVDQIASALSGHFYLQRTAVRPTSGWLGRHRFEERRFEHHLFFEHRFGKHRRGEHRCDKHHSDNHPYAGYVDDHPIMIARQYLVRF